MLPQTIHELEKWQAWHYWHINDKDHEANCLLCEMIYGNGSAISDKVFEVGRS